MQKNDNDMIIAEGKDLFNRVVSIFEQARVNVIRAVNSNMVIAYWLIGREIVNEIQQGKERAKYGKLVIEKLSNMLTEKYSRGFSTTNLRYFRNFFTAYSKRLPKICHIGSGEFSNKGKSHIQSGVLQDILFSTTNNDTELGFSSELGWSHYRCLMRVENRSERLFYEIESEKEHWEVKHLERQINTFLFARLLKSKDKAGVMELTTKGNKIEKPADIIKNPYILDFLGLPESERLHESVLEKAIIDNIQAFLLELGSGFAFVARQKRIITETKEFYIDLVFYNFHLKCFVLIDLKTEGLTHQDVGQMDMYVRMFDDLKKDKDDNPTVGLILCAEKDKTIVKYSVLEESKQLFASKYNLILPTEEELKLELDQIRLYIKNNPMEN